MGCYHIQLPTAYVSFDEALAAAGSVPGGFPAWVDGVYYVRAGAYLSAEAANAAMAGMEGATLAGTSSYAVSVVKTGTGTILFQFDGGAALSLGVKPGLDDGVKTVTWYALNKYYGAFRYQRLSGGNLTVVSIVDREDYINCVISREMSSGWPL
ncbi:SpoIID/LytB domain-containing protein, partial [Bacteroides thetaiotaomicron]